MNVKKKTWIVLVIAAMFSWAGIDKIIQISKDYSAHSLAIADVQGIVNQSSNINSFSNLDALKSSQTKIQVSIKKLKEIPNLPGYPYQNAQNKISLLNEVLVKIESKVKVEEEALNNLQAAQRLDNEAALLVKDKSYSNSWQEAKNKWQQAINLLEKISTETYVSETTKQGISAIKHNLDDVGKVITGEEKSLQDFTTAVELAQKAITLTKDVTNLTLPDLLIAKSQWQQAINLLASISSTTELSFKIQSQLNIYRTNYREVGNAIDEIKKCTSQNTRSESACTAIVSLKMTEPETLIALLKDIKEQDTNNNQIQASINNFSNSTTSNNYSGSTTDNTSSAKAYTDIVEEYKDAIKNDSDYANLKNLADNKPENIRFYAKSYCEAKEKGFTDSEISNHLEEQAERVSNSFSDSDSAKTLLRKAQIYSIELGKKYYCK